MCVDWQLPTDDALGRLFEQTFYNDKPADDEQVQLSQEILSVFPYDKLQFMLRIIEEWVDAGESPEKLWRPEWEIIGAEIHSSIAWYVYPRLHQP